MHFKYKIYFKEVKMSELNNKYNWKVILLTK